MNPLISPMWLSEHVKNSDLVVLDATLPPVGVIPAIDTHARYLAGHIPGALYFDIEKLSDQSTNLPHMLPSENEFSRMMSELGVSDNMCIVVYEQEGVFSAPRAWWMLRAFGAKNVYVLDGGLRAWREAGWSVVSTEDGLRSKGKFNARLEPNMVKGFEQIQRILSGGAQILDARSTARFNGTAPEPRPGLSSGHMPGAISLPFGELVEDGRLKSVDELRNIFATRSVRLGEPITTTCGSGVTAAVVALALHVAGANHVSVYDGSWAEYAQHPEAKIEKGVGFFC